MRSHRFDSVAEPLVMDHLVRRECARADRNGEAFSLVMFHVGRGKRRSMLARRLARTMLKRARLTDDVGWLGEHHLAALLPDTTPDGARAFADKVGTAIARHHAKPLANVYSYPRDRAALSQSPQPLSLKQAVGSDLVACATAPGDMKINGQSCDVSAMRGGNWRSDQSQPPGNRVASQAAGNFKPMTLVRPRSAARDLVAATLPAAKRPALSHPPVSHPPAAAIEELLAYPIPQWKRLLDIVGAGVMLFLLSPILAIAALAIKFTSPGPVIFTQRRAGLGGKPFVIYKFRTMCVNAEKRQQELRAFNEQDGPAFKLTHDPRVTKVGHILRKTSIDELPQLWNVLRGEMSLVGPRPLPLAEQDGCEQWQRHRLNATPGLTCIWQVKGRSTVSFSEWVRMDVEYMRRRTIFHDLTILFSTIPSVLLRRGAR